MSYFQTELSTLSDLLLLDRKFLFPFVFRGQQSISWDLCSSAERRIKEFYYNRDERDVSKCGVYLQEKWMIDIFQRKLHLYKSHIPERNNYFEWLAPINYDLFNDFTIRTSTVFRFYLRITTQSVANRK